MKRKAILKKAIAVLLMVGIVASCLSGCGGKTDAKIDGAMTDKYNITIAAQQDDGELVILQALKEAYEEKNPDVNIIVRDFSGKTYSEAMNTWREDYSLLPMISWMDDRDFASYAEGGYYVDLRPYYEQDLEITDYNEYYQTMLNSASYSGEYRPTTAYKGTVEGKEKSDDAKYGLYFAPRDYNEIVVVYNKTKFADANYDASGNNTGGYDIFKEYEEKYGVDLSDPVNSNDKSKWNWEAFINLLHLAGENIFEHNASASALNERVIYLHNSYEPVYTSIFTELGKQYGNYEGLIGSDGAPLFDSDENQSIYKYLSENIFHYETQYDEDGQTKTKKNINAVTEDSFFNGMTLMTVCPRPTLYSQWNALQAKGMEIDVLPFPTQQIAAGCSGYGITVSGSFDEDNKPITQTPDGLPTKNVVDLCWDFIKFAISEEGQEVASETGVCVPVRKSLIENGVWKQAFTREDGTTINHQAFILEEELPMTMFNAFPPTSSNQPIRASLRTDVTSFLLELENEKVVTDADRKAIINKYIDYFNTHRKQAGLN